MKFFKVSGDGKEADLFARNACLAIVLVSGIGLAGCQDDQGHHEWHQKLTVVVDTPSGEVSGSSVVAIDVKYGSATLTDREVWYDVRGEATFVEIAPGKFLFALLGGDEERYFRAMRTRIPTTDRGEWLKLIPNMEEIAVLQPKNYPLLVTFGDIHNPNSVREVDPNNLAADFGPGVSLNQILLEIVAAPVDTGIAEKALPWIPNYREKSLQLNGEHCVACPVTSENIADLLSSSDFRIGE